MKKEEVINYFINLREDIVFEIDDVLYTKLNNSLSFGDLQKIDHLRQNINTIYKIIEFLEKGDF